MNLGKFRESYYDYTAKASDVARKLAFAGIAIVWIFRTGNGKDSSVPGPLLLPILLFAVTLGLDLLHYVCGSVTWGIFCRIKEKEPPPANDDWDAPAWLNWGTNLLFYAKIASVVAGYVAMTAFLWKLWATS